MKCSKCTHLYHMNPSLDSPYGEIACLKKGTDLLDTASEDVKDCEDFESKEEIE